MDHKGQGPLVPRKQLKVVRLVSFGKIFRRSLTSLRLHQESVHSSDTQQGLIYILIRYEPIDKARTHISNPLMYGKESIVRAVHA